MKEVSQVVISICHDNVSNIDSHEIIAEFERITSRDFDLTKEKVEKIKRKDTELCVALHLCVLHFCVCI